MTVLAAFYKNWIRLLISLISLISHSLMFVHVACSRTTINFFDIVTVLTTVLTYFYHDEILTL